VLDPAGEFLCHLGVIRRLPEPGQSQCSRRGIDSGFHGLKATPQINGSIAVGRRLARGEGDRWSAGKTVALKQRSGSEAGRDSLAGS
jgi:hypothetical protein